MGLTRHVSCVYDTFSSYRVSFYLISSLTKMSLMTSLTMMVLGPGHLVCALFNLLKFPLIVFVECFQLMESQNPVVVSVEYFQPEYFPAQKFSSFKFRFFNMITVCFCLANSFQNTMARREPVAVQDPLRIVQYFRSGRGGEYGVWFTRCIDRRDPKIHELWTFAEDGFAKFIRLLGSRSVTTSPGRRFTLILSV